MAGSACQVCERPAGATTANAICLECQWLLVSKGICPRCSGDGHLVAWNGDPKGWVKCSRCQGSGAVPLEPCTCYVCGGEGTADGRFACGECSGTGMLAPKRSKLVG